MSGAHAAQVLADCTPHERRDLIQAVAAAQPELAGTVMRLLPAAGAGLDLDHLSPSTAASILIAIPAAEAARILSHADVRTAAAVIMQLPVRVATQMIQAMPDKRTADTLAYVRPATVAALLLTAPEDFGGKLLRHFSASFRQQVVHHLGGLEVTRQQAPALHHATLTAGASAGGTRQGAEAEGTVPPLYLDPMTKLFLTALLWCRPRLTDQAAPLPNAPEIARAVLEVTGAFHGLEHFASDPAFRDRLIARVAEHQKILRRKLGDHGLAPDGPVPDEIVVNTLIEHAVITPADLDRLSDSAWAAQETSWLAQS